MKTYIKHQCGGNLPKQVIKLRIKGQNWHIWLRRNLKQTNKYDRHYRQKSNTSNRLEK